jgi:hypothetical protein
MVRFFSGTNTGAVLSDVEVPLLHSLKQNSKKIELVLPLGSDKDKSLKKVLEIAKWLERTSNVFTLKPVSQMLLDMIKSGKNILKRNSEFCD